MPQLVANAAEVSSEGISEGLLWLWVFSDVLDVAGCSFADTVSSGYPLGSTQACQAPDQGCTISPGCATIIICSHSSSHLLAGQPLV